MRKKGFMMVNTGYVPRPKMFGPLGNLPLIDKEQPTLSLCKLAEAYGPIYRLEIPGYSGLVISGHELVAEVCDVRRFDKQIYNELENVRAFSGDGLFTSRTTEPNWQKAHNILLPTFSKQAMKGYHDMMTDIATQLIQKWARLNPQEEIDVSDDMTRLTLDTIGLSGFNYRFNSFYKETLSPFIMSMVRALNEAMMKSSRLKIQEFLMIGKRRQFQEDIQTMFSLVDAIIKERKARGKQDEVDLLARMLHERDPETGETLDDENIRYQIITFLIAGHETTSGLLSFALYFLLKHPDVLKRAYEEVDQVITGDAPNYEEVLKLTYIRMILNESLRLWPTAPGFTLYAKEDTVIGGQYPIRKGENIDILLPQLHRDKNAWGEDANLFRPERFEDSGKVPLHAFKPFGNGQRACIGMQFALHEATLVLGMILQHFDLIDFTNYQLKIQQTLTIKPDDFKIQVKPRHCKIKQSSGQQKNHDSTVSHKEKKSNYRGTNPALESNYPLLVLYGSDLGTAKGAAQQLANEASLYGIQGEVAALDDYCGNLPKEGAVLIISSSYNGQPPRNARKFLTWVDQLDSTALQGINFAVFGYGDRNWNTTYQKIPRLLDEQLSLKGATKISKRGEADASGDFEKTWEDWRAQLWLDLKTIYPLMIHENVLPKHENISIQLIRDEVTTSLAFMHSASLATVVKNEELQGMESKRSTRHIEIALPNGITYQEGDHLGVLPRNNRTTVQRVLRRFGLNDNDQVIITAINEHAHLPLGHPVSLYEVLSHSVDIQNPATRLQIRQLAAFTECPPHKRELEALLEEEAYKKEIVKKRISMLDLLEKYQACAFPFERFLALLPALKPRYYSISSSPQVNSEQLSITVGVLHEPAWSGQGEYRGVASNYLAQCHIGDEIVMFIRANDSGFHLPKDPTPPLIMVGPGTGIAPFRGFLQARSTLKQQGIELGEAHLYFGCRDNTDFIYRKELEQYEKEGVVTLHTAFSRTEGTPKTYVQHLMTQHAATIIQMMEGEGQIFICGDGSKMAPEVESALLLAYRRVKGVGEEDANVWINQLQQEGRYVKDVWVQNDQ